MTFLFIIMRSEEHTSELQSHSEISYAVFCLKKKKNTSQSKVLRPHADLWAVAAVGAFASVSVCVFFFFFNDTATTEIYTNLNSLSLHDALPIPAGISAARSNLRRRKRP